MPEDVQSPEEKPDYFYVRYVTLCQFFREFKIVLALWIGFSLASIICGLTLDVAKSVAVDQTFLAAVPKQFWIWLAVAVFSWTLRGKTFTLPNLSVVSWILLNLWLGGGALADAFLPWWAAVPIYSGLFLLGFIYQQLVDLGRANYESMMPKAETLVEASVNTIVV